MSDMSKETKADLALVGQKTLQPHGSGSVPTSVPVLPSGVSGSFVVLTDEQAAEIHSCLLIGFCMGQSLLEYFQSISQLPTSTAGASEDVARIERAKDLMRFLTDK
jgi:hypothetical protein